MDCRAHCTSRGASTSASGSRIQIPASTGLSFLTAKRRNIFKCFQVLPQDGFEISFRLLGANSGVRERNRWWNTESSGLSVAYASLLQEIQNASKSSNSVYMQWRLESKLWISV